MNLPRMYDSVTKLQNMKSRSVSCHKCVDWSFYDGHCWFAAWVIFFGNYPLNFSFIMCATNYVKHVTLRVL